MDRNCLNPKITVIMPVYNSEQYIEVAIDSILNQTFTNFELIIIDDYSSDRSLDIIKSYKDERIKLLQNDTNLGSAETRNKALHHSLGEYIACLDSDDYAYPSRLEEQLQFMENNPDFGMIGSWVEVMNEQGDLTGEVWKYVENYHKIPSILLFHNYFAHSSVFIRKTVLSSNFYNREFKIAEDYDLWIRIARKHKVGNIQKALIKYRIHSNSVSQKGVNIIEKELVEVACEQLNYLDIKPTPEELALHRKLGSYNYDDINLSINFIKEAYSWLVKLRNQNSKTSVYQNDSFNEVVVDIEFALLSKFIEKEETKFRTIQFELKQTLSQLESTQNELEECKHWIKELQDGKDWLESQYYIWMEIAQNRQTEIEEYQAQLQIKQSQIEKCQTQLQIKQSQIEEYQTQLQTKQSQIEECQTQLQIKQSQIEEYQTQLQTKQSQIEECQTQLQAQQLELTLLQSSSQDIQYQLEELQSSKFWKIRTKWLKIKSFFVNS